MIAGVVVGFATVHANQLAETTLAVVTVPQLEGAIYLSPEDAVESATTIYQSAPTGNETRLLQLLVKRAHFVVSREVL